MDRKLAQVDEEIAKKGDEVRVCWGLGSGDPKTDYKLFGTVRHGGSGLVQIDVKTTKGSFPFSIPHGAFEPAPASTWHLHFLLNGDEVEDEEPGD